MCTGTHSSELDSHLGTLRTRARQSCSIHFNGREWGSNRGVAIGLSHWQNV